MKRSSPPAASKQPAKARKPALAAAASPHGASHPAPVRRPGVQPRIGIHVSSSGGAEKAAERAQALGCSAFQIFTSSPRMWRASAPSAETCARMRQLRAEFDLAPLVIHDNYLINLAAADPVIHEKSLAAFRGELERAVALDAEYLVMHPGSSVGGDHAEAIARLIDSLHRCSEGLAWGRLRLLIENTAGGGNHLGGSFEEVAQILDGIKDLPSGACIDTCHSWVAGYDLVSAAGYEETLARLDATVGLARVPVWHANDAKADRGSHRDRHEHIGEGKLGAATFQRLLQDPRLAHCAFILETPLDQEGDDRKNVEALWRLAER